MFYDGGDSKRFQLFPNESTKGVVLNFQKIQKSAVSSMANKGISIIEINNTGDREALSLQINQVASSIRRLMDLENP